MKPAFLGGLSHLEKRCVRGMEQQKRGEGRQLVGVSVKKEPRANPTQRSPAQPWFTATVVGTLWGLSEAAWQADGVDGQGRGKKQTRPEIRPTGAPEHLCGRKLCRRAQRLIQSQRKGKGGGQGHRGLGGADLRAAHRARRGMLRLTTV